MENYLSLMEEVYNNGIKSKDRTDTGIIYKFGEQIKVDIDSNNFPIITTRKIYWHKILDELFWFLSGSTNVNDLPQRTQGWWSPWADEDGDLGPIYGKQLRDFDAPVGTGAAKRSVDQISDVIHSIKSKPDSRRHIVTTWNPGKVDKMNLPPCHGLTIQFDVEDDGRLNCSMYQRSMDIFIGGPANIASYSFLTSMISKVCGLKPGELTISIGNAHIYKNHTAQVKEQLSRSPMEKPMVNIDREESIDDYSHDSIEVIKYKHHPEIKAPLNI